MSKYHHHYGHLIYRCPICVVHSPSNLSLLNVCGDPSCTAIPVACHSPIYRCPNGVRRFIICLWSLSATQVRHRLPRCFCSVPQVFTQFIVAQTLPHFTAFHTAGLHSFLSSFSLATHIVNIYISTRQLLHANLGNVSDPLLL